MCRLATLALTTTCLALGGCGSSSSQAVGDDGGAADGRTGALDTGGPSPEGGGPLPDGSVPAGDGGAVLTRTFGGRQYLLYVPAAYAAGTPAPLVVMLHGCTQAPADFAAGTQMNAQADAAGFLVAYPDEPSSANVEKCWNWFLPADQARGAGEPAIVAGLVGDVAKDYSVDPRRVFAAGLSAGAAMAVVVGATYPDVFAAIGVHSGLEYAAATSVTAALTASASGGPDPKTQGDTAFAAMGAQARPVPVIVFHGDADGVVNVTNGSQVVAQWTETDTRASAAVGTGVVTTGTAGGRSYTHTTYATGSPASPLLELYLVHGLSHAWSGGSSAGTFTDPSGPDASALFWQFFATHGR